MRTRLPLLLCSVVTLQAHAATYFVGPTGDDRNSGTTREQAWRNPQKCGGKPLAAGDTCLVLPGRYTSPGEIVVQVRPDAPAGTQQRPITLKSEQPHGAVIVVPAHKGRGFHVSAPHYIIDGFDIQGVSNNTNSGHYGILVRETAEGLTIRNNLIHHIGQNVCSTTTNHYANAGVVGAADNMLIENNKFYTIGQLRPGENGCNGDYANQDHGIYYANKSNLTIRNNVFYDVNRGYAIHIYRSGGSLTSNLFIYNNILADRSPIAFPFSQLKLSSSLSNVQIKNNVFYNTKRYGIDWHAIRTVTNLVVANNLTNGMELISPVGRPTSGLTERDNLINTEPRFVNSSSRDYRLLGSSPAIDRGVDVGLPFSGSRPDIGAYEFGVRPASRMLPRAPGSLRVR